MRVPEYIKKKMRRVASLNNAAAREMFEIEHWLEDHGIDTSTEGILRAGDGIGLEELEYGNRGAIDELCERIESLL